MPTLKAIEEGLLTSLLFMMIAFVVKLLSLLDAEPKLKLPTVLRLTVPTERFSL